MLPPALVFVEIPQYGLEFLHNTLVSVDCRKILVIDAELFQRGRYTAEQLADYDAVFPTRLQSDSALLQSRQEIALSYDVIAVLGFSEVSVLPAAILAESFGVIGIGTEVAKACRNKLKMTEAICQRGVNCPPYFVVESGENLEVRVEAIGGYPVICKPLMGFASFGVIKATSELELKQAIRRIKRSARFLMGRYYGLDATCSTGQVLVQAFIPGIEVAIDGYVHEGKSHILAIIDKPDVSQGPYFADAMHIMPARLDATVASLIEKNVQASVAAVGLDNSPFHIEARIFGGRFYFLELAARVAFVRCLRNARGIDPLKIMIALRLGKTPESTPQWQRYSGTYCITPQAAGNFQCLENHKQALQDRRILEIPTFTEINQRVAPAPESTGDIAHVVACADTYDDVLEALTQAKHQIRVVVA